jgi:radical SAM protein with 4Fe4S-binding SPASM domain
MQLARNEKLWNSILKMPSTRFMLRAALKKCPKCDRTRLETASNDYVGREEAKCFSCSLCSFAIRFWIEFLRKNFKVKGERAHRIVGDQYSIRAMKSIIHGFLSFGLLRPLSVSAPFLVVWNFTNHCNLACKHCYLDSGGDPSHELSTSEALKVVDHIAELGVTSLAFSGGEPLMRKDFFEVAKHAVNSGLYVSLATNGTLLNQENVKILKEIGVNYVEVSLDGACPETHDDFRGVKGAFQKSLDGIAACVKEDMCTCLAVTATKRNLKEISSIFNMARDIGARRFTLFNFIPTGRGKNFVELDPLPNEREEILKFLNQKLHEDTGLAIMTTTPQLARVAVQCSMQKNIVMPLAHMSATKMNRKAQALADFIGGCGAGRFYCAVSPEGYVQPCVFLPIVVGDLTKERFSQIWNQSPILKILRDRTNLKGRCGKCVFKYMCGGCRARAYAYFKDYLASDPGCIRELEESKISE